MENIRVIPGYEGYGVTRGGSVFSIERELQLSQYLLNGYLIVDTFRGSATETLPVHRAVALAWVDNSDPDNFTIVNHKDGNPFNNWWENLEWTNHSGNNYHAVNNGLRNDNIKCKIRDFYTKEIINFNSIAQAAEYMGLGKDTELSRLQPKMFGKLISDRYEFRFENDPTPWFYQNRTKLIPPSRYMVTVQFADGTTKEVYSNRTLLQEYKLYDCDGRSIPDLVAFGNKTYPNTSFSYRDGYEEAKYRVKRDTKESRVMPVKATNGLSTLTFQSLTQAAGHFRVDRSSIMNRLNNDKELDGWTFTLMPL